MKTLELGRATLGSQSLTIEWIDRRNWSTVARARGADGSTVFLKQFRDADGGWRRSDLDHEIEGLASLDDLALSSVHVVAPSFVDRNHLVVAYPWHEIDTIDRIVRTSPASVAVVSDLLGRVVGPLVDELVASVPSIAAKHRARNWESAGLAVCPKGLDLRNLGWSPEFDRPLLFDCGPVQVAPVEEAVAKLVCSALLLNFGHPVRRTLVGVDADLADKLVGSIVGRTHRDAFDYELARLWRHRSDEPKSQSIVERWAIRPATAILGRWYWRSMRRWADDHLGQPSPTLASRVFAPEHSNH